MLIYLVVPGLTCSLIFFGTCKLFSCSIWDLVPCPGIKPSSPALGAWSLSHWTTREVPIYFDSFSRYVICRYFLPFFLLAFDIVDSSSLRHILILIKFSLSFLYFVACVFGVIFKKSLSNSIK